MTVRLAALLAVPLFLAACGNNANPFASFETRCARLPPPRFEVVATPLTFERDDTQSIAALTAKSGSKLGLHRAIGLTTAFFGQSTDIELQIIDDRRNPRACGSPRVRVELSMQPMTVFVASELGGASCQHEVTLSHEMKHVEVFRAVLEETARDLERDFPAALDAELARAKTGKEMQQRLVVAIRDYLTEFMAERQQLLDARQAEVDSPEEYARVSTACAQ